jgi:hypothetical protein
MKHLPPLHRSTLLVGVVTSALIGTSIIASPANATSLDRAAVRFVQAAEVVLGLDDDTIADVPQVVSAGHLMELEQGNTRLSLRIGASGSGPDSPSPTFTIDQLDTHTTRIAAVLRSATEATPSWDLGPDAVLIPLPDGRVSVSNADGDLLAGVETPWAVDAAGQELPTHYEVDGSVLRQVVAIGPSTEYPVVADPTLTQFPGYWTAKLNRTESASAVGTVATCAAVFQKAPHPGLKALTITCGALAAFSTAQLAGGKCVKVHVAGAPPVIGTWWPTFPRC